MSLSYTDILELIKITLKIRHRTVNLVKYYGSYILVKLYFTKVKLFVTFEIKTSTWNDSCTCVQNVDIDS